MVSSLGSEILSVSPPGSVLTLEMLGWNHRTLERIPAILIRGGAGMPSPEMINEVPDESAEEREATVHGGAPSGDTFRGNMEKRAERGVSEGGRDFHKEPEESHTRASDASLFCV